MNPTSFYSKNIAAFAKNILFAYLSESNEKKIILCPSAAYEKELNEFISENFKKLNTFSNYKIVNHELWMTKSIQEKNAEAALAPPYLQHWILESLLEDCLNLKSKHRISDLAKLYRNSRQENIPILHLNESIKKFNPESAHLLLELHEKYEELLNEKKFCWDKAQFQKTFFQTSFPNQSFVWMDFFAQDSLLKQIRKSKIYKDDACKILALQCKNEEEALLNKNRFEEEESFFLENKVRSSGKFLIFKYPSDEIAFLVNEIKNDLNAGIKIEDMAVLLPEDQQTRMFLYEALKTFDVQGQFKSYSLKDILTPKLNFTEIPSAQKIEDEIQVRAEHLYQHHFSRDLELRALDKIKTLLSELDFYKSEVPFLYQKNKNLTLTFNKILSQIYLEESVKSPIQLIKINRWGFKKYKKIYICQCTENFIPIKQTQILSSKFQPSLRHENLQKLCNLAEDFHLSNSELNWSGKLQKSNSSLIELFGPLQTKESEVKVWFSSLNSQEKQSQELESRNAENIQNQNLIAQTLKINSPELQKQISEKGLSVTSLNDYLNCPFSFLVKHFYKLKQQEEDFLDLLSLEKGKIAHEYLECFFKENLEMIQKASIQKELRASVFLLSKKLNIKILQKYLNTENSTKTKHSSALYLQKFIESLENVLLEILNEYFDHYDQGHRFIPKYFERKFSFKVKNLKSKLLQNDEIEIHGRIDRIDVSADEKHFSMLDYKTSSKVDSLRNETLKAENLQLYIYILAAEEMLKNELIAPEAVAAIYYSLADSKSKIAVLQEHWMKEFLQKRKQKAFLNEEKWQDWLHLSQTTLYEALYQLQSGFFTAQAKQCYKSCEAYEFCRSPCRIEAI